MTYILPGLADAGGDPIATVRTAEERVFELAESEDATAREFAAAMLGMIGGEDALERVRQLFRESDRWVRAAALFSLSRLDPSGAQGAIQEALDDAFVPVRTAAVSATHDTEWDSGARLVAERIDGWIAEMKNADAEKREQLEVLLTQADELLRDFRGRE